MIVVYYILSAILLVLFLYLVFTSVYLFAIALASIFKKREFHSTDVSQRKIAVLIPCYKEDIIIIDTVNSLLKHDYPKHLFELFVIADQLQPPTIEKLKLMGARVIEVTFEISTKARSLHAALNHIADSAYDIAFILDADNLLAPGCLKKVNHAFSSGCKAVQCHRIAKNENTPLAVLDAINEEINNSLLRKGQWALGHSATASGSGMAFEFSLLKEIFNLPHILQNNGEDKEIDIQLLKRKVNMGYIHDALVLDEKVSSFNAFRKQRLRWVEAYLNYVFRLFYKDLRPSSSRYEFWNRFFQLMILPRSLYILTLIALSCVFVIGSQVGFPFYHPSPWWLVGVAVLYFTTLLLCLPRSYVTWRTVKSLALLPIVFIAMMITVTKVKPKRKEFIHTPKSYSQSEVEV